VILSWYALPGELLNPSKRGRFRGAGYWYTSCPGKSSLRGQNRAVARHLYVTYATYWQRIPNGSRPRIGKEWVNYRLTFPAPWT
jgi:hypothetical protein